MKTDTEFSFLKNPIKQSTLELNTKVTQCTRPQSHFLWTKNNSQMKFAKQPFVIVTFLSHSTIYLGVTHIQWGNPV